MKSFTKTLVGFLLVVCILGSFPPALASGESWLTGWSDRKGITVSNSTGAGTNYPVNLSVSYEPEMQADFDDLRFTEVDGETELDYWIEEYTASTSAIVWMEFSDDLDSIYVEGFMYYGNGAVSTTSDGEATFLFYEDWLVESMNPARWDLIANAGGTSWDNTDANHGSILKLEGAAGANAQTYECVYDDIAPTSIMFRANIEQTLAVNQRIRIGSGSPTIFSFAYIEGNAADIKFTVFDDDANDDTQVMDAAHFGAYHTFEITRDGTNARLYIDTVLDETASCDPDIVSTPAAFIGAMDEEKDLYVDWFAVRKFMAGLEPVAFWGLWSNVNSVEFIFQVGWNPAAQFGYDAFFVFLGLIMIPASTLYLVRGGRKEMNTDKLFIGLIVFCVGLGLFIGGITP